MQDAQFTSTIDYVRAVHAEMAAITDAARHGLPTAGSELFVSFRQRSVRRSAAIRIVWYRPV